MGTGASHGSEEKRTRALSSLESIFSRMAGSEGACRRFLLWPCKLKAYSQRSISNGQLALKRFLLHFFGWIVCFPLDAFFVEGHSTTVVCVPVCWLSCLLGNVCKAQQVRSKAAGTGVTEFA